jgi:Fe-S-cluster containining protein
VPESESSCRAADSFNDITSRNSAEIHVRVTAKNRELTNPFQLVLQVVSIPISSPFPGEGEGLGRREFTAIAFGALALYIGRSRSNEKKKMDQMMSDVVRAVERGATTVKGVIDATGLSRLKVERALRSLEKQKLLVRDGQGFRAPAISVTPSVRQCGSCSSCCTILEVEAVGKPVNQWCQHCDAGKGCKIYDDRPLMCRSFSCAWLQGHLDDDWYPERAGMVVHFSQDAVNIAVDPAFPDRWKQEPYFSKLSEWSLNGIRMTGQPGYATLVVAGSDKFLLLGRTIVPDPTPFGTAFLATGPATFRYWRARSQEHLQRLNERVAEIGRIRREFGYCAMPDDDDPYPPYRPGLLELSKISHSNS